MKYSIHKLEHLALDEQLDQTLVVHLHDEEAREVAEMNCRYFGCEAAGIDPERYVDEDIPEEHQTAFVAGYDVRVAHEALRHLFECDFMPWLYENKVKFYAHGEYSDIFAEGTPLVCEIYFEDFNQMLLFKLTFGGAQ